MLAELMAVRHAESAANAAWVNADPAAQPHLRPASRDADSPLTERGVAQAVALGHWLAALPAQRRPEAVLCSPFLRTRRTTEIALSVGTEAGRRTPPVRLDERLRDRDTGVWELLTPAELRSRYPDEPVRRDRIGKLYYRPPGGESMADVALRLRTLLADLDRAEAGRRILLVAHDAVVLMLRMILEGLSEEDLIEVIAGGPVHNASVTRWVRHGGRLTLAEYNISVQPQGLRDSRIQR